MSSRDAADRRSPRDRREDEGSKRPDPDAPGNYVDDEESAEIPEPNEPA